MSRSQSPIATVVPPFPAERYAASRNSTTRAAASAGPRFSPRPAMRSAKRRRRDLRREHLVRGQWLDLLARAVVEVGHDGARQQVLQYETIGAVVAELLLRRLVGPQAPRRADRPHRPVVQAVGDGVGEVDGKVAIAHERRHRRHPSARGPQDHPHGVGDLRLTLAATCDRRVGVGRRRRTGDREPEDLGVVVGLAAVVRLDHRREQARDMDQLADSALPDQLGDAGGGPRELVRVADHQVSTTFGGGVDEVPGVRRLEDHRFLDHHVDTGIERRSRQRVVVDVRHDDHHAVDDAGFEQLLRIGVRMGDGEALSGSRQLARVGVGDRRDLGAVVGRQARQMCLRRPPPGTNHADSWPSGRHERARTIWVWTLASAIM